jgi:hypothetical protein
MNTIIIRKGILYLLLAAAFALCVACGADNAQDDNDDTFYYYPASTQTESDEAAASRDLFLVLSMDSTRQIIQVYRYADGLRYQYAYGLDTQFLDKYGNRVSEAQFTSGKAVYPGGVDAQGKLVTMQIADDVWEYDNVRRFSVDQDRGVFTIADTKYGYDENLLVLSEEEEVRLKDLSESDRLTVVGRDKQILAVIVTTGHGTLQLENTSLFEGSYLQLDTSVFAQITSNMKMELAEGTYTLSVANDGWGGSCNIEITRGETTTVDLDTIKGSGPKYGTILFVIDVEGATLSIDGEPCDYASPMELRYGWHTMEVTASGYDDWSKYLYVNSQEATIVIELSDETDETTATVESGTSEEANNDDAEASQDETTSEAASENDISDDLLEDYVSSLTEMLTN